MLKGAGMNWRRVAGAVALALLLAGTGAVGIWLGQFLF